MAQRTVKDLGPPIAVGRTGEVFAWDEGRVMKLYHGSCSRDDVRREAAVSRLVHGLGLPAPAVHDADTEDGLWEVERRLGILYDWIRGPTMLRDLVRRPWKAYAHSRSLAALHAWIHAQDGNGLPGLHERIRRRIDRLHDLLPERLRAAADAALSRLPSGRAVCHGDFHPDNILLSDGGPKVVDWGPATCGPPMADVAWTFLLFTVVGRPVDASLAMRVVLRLIRRLALRIYLRTYFHRTGTCRTDLERWVGVMAVLRLADRIPEEQETLLALVESRLGSGSPPTKLERSPGQPV
jgi:aminoglycoside phosphotransferase (APT) family kinase protein